MESILDFDKELDLPFLDKVVTSFYHGSGPDVTFPSSSSSRFYPFSFFPSSKREFWIITNLGLQHKLAQRVLTQFQEHPDAWTRADAILEYAQVRETKCKPRLLFVYTMR
jgi:exportin-1